MTGALLTRRAWRIVSAETCEMSTSIPSRFISRTTLLAETSTARRACGLSVAESAQSSVSEWVNVM